MNLRSGPGHGHYGIGSHNNTPYRPSLGSTTDHHHDRNHIVTQRSSSMYSLGDMGLPLDGLSLDHTHLPPPPPSTQLSVQTHGSPIPTPPAVLSEPSSPQVTPLPHRHI